MRHRLLSLCLLITTPALLLALGLSVPAAYGDTATPTATATRTPYPTIVCKASCDNPEPPALRTATPRTTETPIYVTPPVISPCPVLADGNGCRVYLPLINQRNEVQR